MIGRSHQHLQQSTPFFKRHAAQVVSIGIEDIEQEQGYRNAFCQARDSGRVGANALLNQVKARAAVLIKRADLAIQPRFFGLHQRR